MNCEIKFRQPRLDGNGKFIDWFYWGFIEDRFISPIRVYAPNFQYTGIKDKNGNEIYKGDVVRLNYGIPPTADVFLVEWKDNGEFNNFYVSGWWMKNLQRGHHSASLHRAYQEDLEIIGNIYENPELLKI